MDVKGAVCVVTGAGSGIGRALSQRLATAGAGHIVVADLNTAAAEETAKLIGGSGVSARHLDVREGDAVRALVEETQAAQGTIDLYCSNAGVVHGGGLDLPDAVWQQEWEIHVMAHVHAARALIPAWLERGRGYLLATVSAAGLLGLIDSAPYGATKSAALSFMEWLSINYGDHGVRCSAICPEGVRTPMLPPDNFLYANSLSPQEVAESALRGVEEERFLILPHAEVRDFALRRAEDHDGWVKAMARFAAQVRGNAASAASAPEEA